MSEIAQPLETADPVLKKKPAPSMIPIKVWAEQYGRTMREAVALYREGKAPPAVGAISRWLYLDQWAKWNGISLNTARKLYEEDRTPVGVYMCGYKVGPELWFKSDKAWGDIIMEMQRQMADFRLLADRFRTKRVKWAVWLREARKRASRVAAEHRQFRVQLERIRHRVGTLNRTLQLALVAHQRGDLFLSRTEAHRVMEKREVEKARDRRRLGVENYFAHMKVRKRGVEKVEEFRKRHPETWSHKGRK